jgi:hypothetical protein
VKKRNRLLMVGLLVIIVIIIFPPIAAPLVHDNDSPRSALREAIFKDGHPYQSFFALIIKGDYKDKNFGQRYSVYWINYDSPTGDTSTICYTKENESEEYDITCGTGP